MLNFELLLTGSSSVSSKSMVNGSVPLATSHPKSSSTKLSAAIVPQHVVPLTAATPEPDGPGNQVSADALRTPATRMVAVHGDSSPL